MTINVTFILVSFNRFSKVKSNRPKSKSRTSILNHSVALPSNLWETIHRRKMGRHKNGTQEAIMVHFMQKHSVLATGNLTNREQRNALWIELANKLNTHGPPKKPAKRWKKVWFDWRTSVKRKILYDRIDANAAELENMPYKKTLSAAEHDVALICGFYDTLAIDNADNYNAELQDEDLSTQFSDSSRGAVNVIKNGLKLANENENPLVVTATEKKNDFSNSHKFESNINVCSFAQDAEIATASRVKIEVEEDKELNLLIKKRKLNAADAENVETGDLVQQLVKEQTKVINTVSTYINENINSHQENLHILKDLRQSLREMCASINQLSGATIENLKEQRRHNYEMEKLRKEELLLQKQQLQLNEMKVFGKDSRGE